MTHARFKIGDAVLYKKQRYMITSRVWVDPFPGYFTWHIERLLDHSEYSNPLNDPLRINTLESVMEHGVISEREDGRYREYNVSEDDLEGVDDPPTWELVDDLRGQVAALSAALMSRFHRETKPHKRKGW